MTQTYPLPFPGDASSNPIADRPRYNTAGAADWANGTTGLDPGRPDAISGVAFAKASVSLASDSGGAAAADYVPRNQNAKLLPAAAPIPAQGIGKDIGVPIGTQIPSQPYPTAADTPPAAPTVVSLAPNTAAQAQLPIMITVTGTNFTRFSQVFTGGAATPEASAAFVNATTMRVPIWAAAPGTVSVAVMDHSVMSNVNVLFTVT
jgi:hypothetical protein